ncbi:SGNH/GDSL hydrolase family protein [Actinomycetospora termitidis]|uniref:SGNH/GDSL hydrolase family protein n=1 Tax=Actinomycetospora termitidis TaxID=3053470 RepID=A0ABT7MFV6_9PSEU|nr:SGNH/GDSL hydrolase family protein [Actinomycetospora sp. Odt1-22]MDL5159563.1 SGNH/GDSL hydrolase family protein [Actinomycetospora sp. Odt1-22]
MSRPRRRLRRAVRRLRHGRLPLLAAAVAAVIVVVAIVTTGHDVSRSVAPAAASGPAASSTAPSDGSRSVAVLGDSISEGTPFGGKGAANWTQLVAAQRHWTVTNTAVGGTGYVYAGSSRPFEEAQLERAVAARPELVVIEGSRNDMGTPVDQIRAASTHLYRALQARLPGVRLVVVGPFWNAGSSQKAFATRDALADSARAAGASFVDPMAENWFTGAYDGGPLIGADHVHPTDAGHALYAQRLGAALDRLQL